MNLSEAIFEYCASERFLFLADKLKGHAEQLLAQWVTTVDDDLDFDTLESSVNGIVTLDLPIDAKRSFPDLLELDHLTVSGDVTFGKNVTLKGAVIIVAEDGRRFDIAEGSVLENAVITGHLRILDH